MLGLVFWSFACSFARSCVGICFSLFFCCQWLVPPSLLSLPCSRPPFFLLLSFVFALHSSSFALSILRSRSRCPSLVLLCSHFRYIPRPLPRSSLAPTRSFLLSITCSRSLALIRPSPLCGMICSRRPLTNDSDHYRLLAHRRTRTEDRRCSRVCCLFRFSYV